MQYHFAAALTASTTAQARLLLPSHGRMLAYLTDALFSVRVADVDALVSQSDLFAGELGDRYTYYVQANTIELAERHERVHVSRDDELGVLVQFFYNLGADYPDTRVMYYPDRPNLAKLYRRIL